MTLEQEITHFKMELLRKMPFYGDILMRVPIVADLKTDTACTDGRTIYYNPRFFASQYPAARHYILMHEVLHIMLLHCPRAIGKKAQIWNVASDLVVNHILDKLARHMTGAHIAISRPSQGLFSAVLEEETAENLYEKILAENKNRSTGNTVQVTIKLAGDSWNQPLQARELPVQQDILPMTGTDGHPLSPQDAHLAGELMQQMIQAAAQKSCGDMDSCYIPNQIYRLTVRKKLDWKKLLSDFLSEEISEDSSYATPERKYLHMGMILPGHTSSEEKLETVWAFVDSSGSIQKSEMEQFLTQLHQIVRQFQCTMNIAYWDMQVTDVYTNIQKEEDILKSLPKHSGGTDINCVYRWLQEQHLRPEVMLILTDGYFGRLQPEYRLPSLARKTILVLDSNIQETNEMKSIGKITRL